MNKFLINLLSFSASGLCFLFTVISLYLLKDPFKVLYSYDSYYKNNDKVVVTLNKDFVSTSTFLNNLNKSINYDSFILGNSRSIFYEISEWKTHIGDDAECYHFDAAGESLWALTKKIELIDKTSVKIENLLLILDYSTLIQDEPKKGHLGTHSPALEGGSSQIEFQMTFLSTFFSPKFLVAYLDYSISKKVKPYMKEGYLLSDIEIMYNPRKNEIKFNRFEKMIDSGTYYLDDRMSVFFKRDMKVQKVYPISIREEQMNLLAIIDSICTKHDTRVKVIINPLYNQMKINSCDLNYLRTLFGNENVADFSGINDFTKDYKNYYESSHYRPHVASQILDSIYKEPFD
jgi:hypothetical protein